MLWGCGSLAHGADHGVVMVYHDIDDSTPPATSVMPHQFRAHLDYLDGEGFTVLRLSAMLGALARGEPVPDNAVAITFDDAYPSVYATATPELVARGMPFTVFIATNDIDRGNATYMTWAQLRSLDRTFADFGAHSLSHGHLLERRRGESEAQWRERAGEEIRAGASRIETALDTEVASFAYPYGEYDEALVELVAAAGLYGLSQQSGAFGAGMSPQQVPRFPMGGGYDGLTRLVTAVRSRPLPVTAPRVRANAVRGAAPTTLEIATDPGPYKAAALACYGAGVRLSTSRTGATWSIDLPPLKPDRNKINCTAPSMQVAGEYFWYSHLWTLIDADGRWLTR